MLQNDTTHSACEDENDPNPILSTMQSKIEYFSL